MFKKITGIHDKPKTRDVVKPKQYKESEFDRYTALNVIYCNPFEKKQTKIGATLSSENSTIVLYSRDID